jgi:hypothetical protein
MPSVKAAADNQRRLIESWRAGDLGDITFEQLRRMVASASPDLTRPGAASGRATAARRQAAGSAGAAALSARR